MSKIEYFTRSLFTNLPELLHKEPVQVPSGKYEESIKVERTQQDLINEMAKELSDLPRFTAYTKTIEGEQTAIHKIRTEPFPKGLKEVEIESDLYHTDRARVNRQIIERLNREPKTPPSNRPPRNE